jgi:hypothetical protein
MFGEGVDEVPHRLEALRIPVVDSLEVVHGTGTLAPPTDAPEHDRPRRHRDLGVALEPPRAVYGHGEPAVMRDRAAPPPRGTKTKSHPHDDGRGRDMVRDAKWSQPCGFKHTLGAAV